MESSREALSIPAPHRINGREPVKHKRFPHFLPHFYFTRRVHGIFVFIIPADNVQ